MNLPTPSRHDSIKGLIYGTAFGDAWGYVTEFMKHREILRRKVQPPVILQISDDTQMSIYNYDAMRTIKEYEIDLSDLNNNVKKQATVRRVFAEEHLNFYDDPENFRAPGFTCMGALKIYRDSYRETGQEGSINNVSKGCGTIMRAPWLGAFELSREEITLLSIIQAQTTHGHPTGWIVSAVAALITHDILYRSETREILLSEDTEINRKFIYRVKAIVHEIQAIDSNLVKGIDFQFAQVIRDLEKLDRQWDHFITTEATYDVTKMFGEGWVSDEVLYNSIMITAFYSARSPYSGIQRLVETNGDSDSLASVAGAFMGTLVGYDKLSYNIDDNVENIYKDDFKEIVAYLS